MRNIEIKARIKDTLSIIEKVKKLSGTSGEIIHQHDTFYNSTHGRLKLRKFKVNFQMKLKFWDFLTIF